MSKLLVVLSVIVLVGVSIISSGVFAALAELAAFAVVIVWALKSKQAVKRNEAQIEPHV
ncbi:hypothetical protein ACGRL8_05150 [Vibrio rumoiensis]|uniref:hypothetical protein n=1 Tax=Vibrio rumoiensis TaxID=76258 RepID=UPI0013A5979C|nr:hypothetical protein [Vibrio rumoiensis]